jgi:hypothetical protein
MQQPAGNKNNEHLAQNIASVCQAPAEERLCSPLRFRMRPVAFPPAKTPIGAVSRDVPSPDSENLEAGRGNKMCRDSLLEFMNNSKLSSACLHGLFFQDLYPAWERVRVYLKCSRDAAYILSVCTRKEVGKQTLNWSLEKRFSASGSLSVGGESGDAEEEQSKLHCLHFHEVHLGQQGVWMRTGCT